ATIARAVGETVAGRMHESLGPTILQRLAAERPVSASNGVQSPPRPPSPGPPSPGVGLNLTEAGTHSLPPRPPSPGPPSPGAGLNLTETRIQSSPPRAPSAGPPSPGAGLNLDGNADTVIASSPPKPLSPDSGLCLRNRICGFLHGRVD